MTHTTIIEGNRRMWFLGNCLIDKKIDVLFSLLFFSRPLSIREGKNSFLDENATLYLWSVMRSWGSNTDLSQSRWLVLYVNPIDISSIERFSHDIDSQVCTFFMRHCCVSHKSILSLSICVHIEQAIVHSFKWIRFCLHTSRPNVLKIIYVLSTNE